MSKFSETILSARHLLSKNTETAVGAAFVTVYVVTALVVGIANALRIRVTPFDPLQENSAAILAPPSIAHFFGTDLTGRDVFSRIVIATPNDVAVGFVVVGVALSVGAILGSVAALKGGLMDEVLMRVTDTVFALPGLVIALAIAVALGTGVTKMMVALAIVWWPPYARLTRGEALKVGHQNYIKAARLSGMSTSKIIFRHVLPNVFTTILVYATLDVGTVILAYAGLSYLGLSVNPPFPDWGEMVSAYQDYLITAPWLPILPGVIIAIAVIGFSLFGDGLRDALEGKWKLGS